MAATRLGLRGVVGQFYARLDAVTSDSWEGSISMLMNSDQFQEEYKWLGQTPPMREWIGGREAADLLEKGIIIVNKTYEATLNINNDELRRDKSGQLMVRVNELADRAAEHWGKLLSTLIVTPGNSYDGVSFFNSAHTEDDSGAQDNLLVAGDVPALDVTTPTSPTVEKMNLAIIGVLAKLLAFKDNQGEPMNANARQFVLMVPTNLLGASMGAVNNALIAAGSGSQTNTLQNGPYNINVVHNPRLDAVDTVFYLFRTDASAAAFIRQQELFETGMEEQGFMNNRTLFGVKANRNVGVGYWQYAVKATLS